MHGPSASTSPFLTRWPLTNDRLLIDAGVLVGALELGHLIDVRAHFARKLPFVDVAFDANDDAFAIHRIDHSGALADHHRARIARRHALHAGADIRRIGAQQRNRLALHVRSHQRAVGVVVFKERNQARRHLRPAASGLTSMYSISPTCFSTKLPAWRAFTSSAVILPFSSRPTLACAMMYLSSSQAER